VAMVRLSLPSELLNEPLIRSQRGRPSTTWAGDPDNLTGRDTGWMRCPRSPLQARAKSSRSSSSVILKVGTP
jgi:hypothetical protein